MRRNNKIKLTCLDLLRFGLLIVLKLYIPLLYLMGRQTFIDCMQYACDTLFQEKAENIKEDLVNILHFAPRMPCTEFQCIHYMVEVHNLASKR